MKVLAPQDVDVEDILYLRFKGTFDPQVEIERALEPFFQALEEYAGEWMPDFVKGKRRRKYTRAAVWKSLAEERDKYGSLIGLSHKMYPWVDMTVSLGLGDVPHPLRVSLDVKPLNFFMEAERCRKFVELVRAWASHYPGPYASASSEADRELAGFPNFGRDDETMYRDGFDKIYEVCWLNVFGPQAGEPGGA